MISLFSCSNKLNSNSSVIVSFISDLLNSLNQAHIVLNLNDLPEGWIHNEMYEEHGMHHEIKELERKFFQGAEKFIFIIPEYNGSFPGILKTFIDAVSVRDYQDTFENKKACLIGLSAGKAGNLRGLEHFSGILNYLGTTVYPNKLPLSSIETLLEKVKLIDEDSRIQIESLIEKFVNY